MNSYTLLIDADDNIARAAASHHFTDIVASPSPDSASHVELTFTATDAALNAYADEFDLDHDEFRDLVINIP